MRKDFPENKGQFLSPGDFQDNETVMTFLGWDQKANEDDPKERKGGQNWKQKLKYQLRYSYPQMAVDEVGDPRVGKDGEQFQNRYWDPAYPQGYTIVYHFEQGDLETGSLPLFQRFCSLRPAPGEKIAILRTGKDKETKWSVRRLTANREGLQEIDLNASGRDPLDNTLF